MKRAKRHKVGGFNLTFVRIHDDRSVIMKTHVAFLLFPRQYVIIDPIVDPMSNHIMPACYTNLLLIAVVRWLIDRYASRLLVLPLLQPSQCCGIRDVIKRIICQTILFFLGLKSLASSLIVLPFQNYMTFAKVEYERTNLSRMRDDKSLHRFLWRWNDEAKTTSQISFQMESVKKVGWVEKSSSFYLWAWVCVQPAPLWFIKLAMRGEIQVRV